MLMTKIKDKADILSQVRGKVFIVTCFGCKEINLAEAELEAQTLIAAVGELSELTGLVTADYICNPEYLEARFEKHAAQIEEADTILVFSCGVGAQTLAEHFAGKRVITCCDTYRLPGFQGVTPLEHDCQQCGECYLNLTGGICPLTACSKALVNGQCGGAKNGKCEVDPEMDCGWERIIRKLTQIGRLDVLKCPVQIRNYATDDEVK